MSKNGMADILAAAAHQGRIAGKIDALRKLSEHIEEKRKSMIEKQYEGEYNRGYVDGLNVSFMTIIEAARRGDI
ncbi:hypothetical protein UFOVP1131_88 [uncultured Caudovirales phage]|uniref:Uncharacterized protein n=1 Tax=uncultured Caudovirales phage TaxID=2100421 RepID=A0A6J5QZS0_9CAUD|nr:hypothetical protein UFOVP966_102 [uncultured Caudovirales phage]CAB4184974.1 hypothetical protein UFOVP1131_88 [uncultured Caudovirales phage]CAB4192836.1 hypothetical protein UFOVP1245_98 [uncultured Caudovirales phage]CAB5231408.1 hypothetical protein UFOVP1582_80 [uncultured Caudovirales phage]